MPLTSRPICRALGPDKRVIAIPAAPPPVQKIPPATRAKWLAEKAGWRLANRGDTWYAAERRLYKRQMTELRKSLHLEDLQRRRAEYVAARDAPPKVYEHDEDELESKAESARYLLLRAAATDKARKERELQAANHLYVNTRRRDGRRLIYLREGR